ncbi:sugar ABC transporter permease [Pseudoclostridium thermosuccinogenes]|jgi:ABC-type sugar transport system permease subunit|uniref:carbohydrate ABC transporter permease n=1 Tax=Clostridium thermosuccinogenes TaxID=84032 RepID=UPI002FDB27D1
MKIRRITLRQKRAVTGLLFILPWFIGFVVYYVRSLILTVQFSLSNVEIMKTGGYQATYTGLSNYRYAILEHARFNQVLVNSLSDILIDIPFIIFFSLFMAILLNSKFKGRSLVRVIFFLPILMGSGAVLESLELATRNIIGGASAMIEELSAGNQINIEYFLNVFEELGLPAVLVDYITGLVSRIFEIVRASSVQIIIFIAALQSIPNSLYECAIIEGATGYETFWKITFPMVSPLILTNVVYTIVDFFVNSQVADLAYEMAFTNYNYGLSAAMSIISTVVICFILAVVSALITRKTFYYN